MPKQNSILKRVGVLVFSSIAILASASSCSLFGGDENNIDEDTTYGVLKRDPSVAGKDGYYSINITEETNGERKPDGLTKSASLKLLQAGNDKYYLLNNKGLYITTNGGRHWNRQYIYSISGLEGEDLKKQIDKNNNFNESDIAIDPSNPSTIYISGSDRNGIGKIYKSINDGFNFEEIYTEVVEGTTVRHVAVSPTNSSTIYATLTNESVIKSTDKGKSWAKIRQIKNNKIVQAGFLKSNEFFVLLDKYGIGMTGDGGTNWEFIEFQKTDSKIGEKQSKEGINLFEDAENFGIVQKIVPVKKSPTTDPSEYMLIADDQLWYTSNLKNRPFTKIVLPLQEEKQDILDVEYDPKLGSQKLLVSIGDKIFESSNHGISWSSTDQINVNGKRGNITQIHIDENDTELVYLLLSF